METNNNGERRVLISFKVSTFFIVLISIIILAAVAVAIGNYITGKQIKPNKYSENNLEEINSEETVLNQETPTIQMSERTVIPSSRYSGRREEITISNVEEQEEEIIEEESEDLVIVSTPIEEVTISVDMDLNIRTGLSKDDFIKLIDSVEQDTSGFFKENAS